MKHESSRVLYRYWDKLRGARIAPYRTAIEPAAIADVLRDTFILQSDSPGLPFRLAGTRLCAMFGHELKSVSFTELWHREDRDQLYALLEAVSEEGRAAILGVQAEAGGERHVGIEMLLLPLIQAGPRFDRILGVAAPVAVPYWLGVDPLTTQRIVSARLLTAGETDRIADGESQPMGAMRLPAASEPMARRERFVVLDGGKST